jgi:hypothetical protein
LYKVNKKTAIEIRIKNIEERIAILKLIKEKSSITKMAKIRIKMSLLLNICLTILFIALDKIF